MGIFSKIAQGLKKTKDSFLGGLQRVFNSFTKIDEELFEKLEEQMIMSDIGVETSEEICTRVRKKVKERGITDPNDIMELIYEVISEMMGDDTGLDLTKTPAVIMVIGVNGAGKTTTIGKLAYQFKNEGKKVLVAAADTFRAAAIDQLQVWTDRAGVDIVKHAEGSDPGAVVYDSLEAAKARGCDVVIIDTAGRLHNKKNLMEELKKINRIIDSKSEGSSREILLVLDATTGQNAVSQAKLFGETAPITGIVLTKLDGTAKGGIVISIKNELGIPVKLIGVGEKIDDLQPFNSRMFVDALFDIQEAEAFRQEHDTEETETEDIVSDEEAASVEETETEAESQSESIDYDELPEKIRTIPGLEKIGGRYYDEDGNEILWRDVPETKADNTISTESDGILSLDTGEVIEERAEETISLSKQEEVSADETADEEPVEPEEEEFEEEEDEEEGGFDVDAFDENAEITVRTEYEFDENFMDNFPDEKPSAEDSDEEDSDETDNESVEDDGTSDKKKKKGFFSRLFGRKE